MVPGMMPGEQQKKEIAPGKEQKQLNYEHMANGQNGKVVTKSETAKKNQ